MLSIESLSDIFLKHLFIL